jgi:hypothetical protein
MRAKSGEKRGVMSLSFVFSKIGSLQRQRGLGSRQKWKQKGLVRGRSGRIDERGKETSK